MLICENVSEQNYLNHIFSNKQHKDNVAAESFYLWTPSVLTTTLKDVFWLNRSNSRIWQNMNTKRATTLNLRLKTNMQGAEIRRWAKTDVELKAAVRTRGSTEPCSGGELWPKEANRTTSSAESRDEPWGSEPDALLPPTTPPDPVHEDRWRGAALVESNTVNQNHFGPGRWTQLWLCYSGTG